MSQQYINIGATPNDGLGDPIRTAFQKTNENFSELYANSGNGGNANTGNVTFDNINIIGTGNLHLQPDPANTSAFLDIYLTGGPDIHIAGNGENVIIGSDDAANVTVGDGSTAALYWASTDITSQGRAAISNASAKLVAWSGAASTASPYGIGVGPTDVTIVATLTPTVAAVTAGTVQYTIIYSVANSDGTQSPSGFQN